VNPRTRRAALYAIGAIAILASANALTHSYAGLYDWAVHHRLGGWQAMSWPAEIDVFLAIGELSLYVAYLDGWPARHRVWPWATALTGLVVSVAGNVGHIQPEPGQPVTLADRLTAATSPVAAFAGLAVGLLVLKMTRQQTGNKAPITAAAARPDPSRSPAPRPAAAPALSPGQLSGTSASRQPVPVVNGAGHSSRHNGNGTGHGLLHEASLIYQAAAASGERISQRALARQLRGHGHRFSNQHLHGIAASIGLSPEKAT
jgi:hypothetical protein